jgi:WD40 repeat protein
MSAVRTKWLRYRRLILAGALAAVAYSATAAILWWQMDVRPRIVLTTAPLRDKYVDCFSPDGQWLATRSYEWRDREFRYVLQLWQVETGREQARIARDFVIPEDGAGVWFEKPEFSPDCRHLVLWWGDQRPAGKTLTLLNIVNGATRTFEATDIRFSPDSRFLALMRERDNRSKCIGLVDLATGERHSFDARNLCFSLDGRHMAAVVEDDAGRQTLQLVDTASREVLCSVARSGRMPYGINAFWGLQFLADGRSLAYAKNTGVPPWRQRRRGIRHKSREVFTFWDLQTRRPQLTVFSGWQLSPDGKTLALTGSTSGKDWLTLWNVITGQCIGEFDLRSRVLTFSEDGSKFAIVDNQNDTITTWDIKNSKILSRIESYLNPNTNLFFQRFVYPKKDWLPRVVFQQRNRNSEQVTVREVATGRELFSLPFAIAGQTPWFSDEWYTFTPDERMVVTCQAGEKPLNRFQEFVATWFPFITAPETDRVEHWVRYWDLDSGHEYPKLPGCQKLFAISADSHNLAALCDDGEIKLWDLPPRKPFGLILAWSCVPAGLVLVLAWWRGRRLRAQRLKAPCGTR